METVRFFADLAGWLASARQVDRRRYERFFYELAPRLNVARSLELELDRHLARRFNVFDYLRTDELGLSRIVADLLDPSANHAQGALFLRSFLEGLPESLKQCLPTPPNLETCRVSVAVEQEIPSGRSIDIVVRIVTPGGEICCLAIENKPYARDSDNQVRDYLEYLEKQYGERFFLIYMPPRAKVRRSGASTGRRLTRSGGAGLRSLRTMGAKRSERTNSMRIACRFLSPTGSESAGRSSKPSECGGSCTTPRCFANGPSETGP